MGDRRIPASPVVVDTSPTELPTVSYHRLSMDAYTALEGILTRPVPSATTSDIQAGFMLGIQHTLNLLRTGFVVGA